MAAASHGAIEVLYYSTAQLSQLGTKWGKWHSYSTCEYKY